MKVDFNYPVLDIEGQEMFDAEGRTIIAGKILANALVMQSEGEVAKYFDWAMHLVRGETIDLDRTDQEVVKGFIRNSRTMVILIKKRLMEAFEKNGTPSS